MNPVLVKKIGAEAEDEENEDKKDGPFHEASNAGASNVARECGSQSWFFNFFVSEPTKNSSFRKPDRRLRIANAVLARRARDPGATLPHRASHRAQAHRRAASVD